MFLDYFVIFGAFFIIYLTDSKCDGVGAESSSSGRHNHESGLTYGNILKLKHAEHLQAAKSILSIGDYSKQYQMLSVVYNKMFEILSSAKVVIETSGYVHGEDFPKNITVQEALSSTVENTLFFSNILLHLPDMSLNILKNKKEWVLVLQWSWQICQEMPFLDNQMTTVLNLAGQELGFIQKDPNYNNPFKTKERKKDVPPTTETLKSPKKKKIKTRGPRMSNANHGEL